MDRAMEIQQLRYVELYYRWNIHPNVEIRVHPVWDEKMLCDGANNWKRERMQVPILISA